MLILDQIDPLIFLISLLIGLLYGYFRTPTVTTVIKYPTPFNIKNTVYQDINGVCYKYKIKEIDCPLDKSRITENIPIRGHSDNLANSGNK